MAYEISNYAVKATFVAAVDLTDAQYKFVEFSPTGDTVGVAYSGANAIGVLQNAPKAGQEAEVVLVGITKVKAISFIYAGQPVTCQATATDSGSLAWSAGDGGAILGKALTNAAAGEIATVAVSTLGAHFIAGNF